MKMRMIPVDRGSRSKALKAVVAATKAELARNRRQLIIYPEGTRRAPGDEPAYKYGIVEIYRAAWLPVVPVAHVAGLYWPRRKFLRYPGTIKARFLPPIPPGLGKDEFMQRLIAETEAACDALLIEAAGSAKSAAAAADRRAAAHRAWRQSAGLTGGSAPRRPSSTNAATHSSQGSRILSARRCSTVVRT